MGKYLERFLKTYFFTTEFGPSNPPPPRGANGEWRPGERWNHWPLRHVALASLTAVARPWGIITANQDGVKAAGVGQEPRSVRFRVAVGGGDAEGPRADRRLGGAEEP